MRDISIVSFRHYLIIGFDNPSEVIPLDLEGFEDAYLQPRLWTVLRQHRVEILRGDLGFALGFPHALAELFPT
jgi:hypothetical protein